jgi:hypothetical protein
LRQDHAVGMVHRGEQMHLPHPVLAGAAQGLAVDRDRLASRPWCGWWLLVGQPPADDQVQRVRVDAGQYAAHGRLACWLVGAAQRVAAHPERGQDGLGRVRRPFPDRRQGPGPGQHRGHRDRKDANQRVASAASLPWVGDLREVVEQAAALVRRERDGRVRPMGDGGNEG